MCLLVPSASLHAAMAATQAFLSVQSTHAVDNVDFVYNNKMRKQGSNDFFSVGQECFSNTSSNLRGVDADVGILSGCSDSGVTCVEDSTSSLGGRCVPFVTKQRQVQTSCTKCTPASACEGLSQVFIENNIGEGSCCGVKACVGVSFNTTIGAGSCIGNKNCYGLQGANIGDGSCNGESVKGKEGYVGFACAHARGTIGDNSCYEYAACYQTLDDSNKGYVFNVGNNSCRKQSSCFYSSQTSIGDGSCDGEYACHQSYGSIGKTSCNGYYTCYKNKGVIGSNSCNARLACENNLAYIGDLFCNAQYECRGNSSPITSAPTKAPTKAVTPSPTSKPTTPSPTKADGTRPPTAKPVTPVPTKNPTKRPNPATTSPTRKTTTSSPTRPNASRFPTSKPTNSPSTLSPTKKDATLAPTKKLNPSPSPTGNPTKDPTTKIPTSKPTTAPPTQKPATVSPSLVLSVDLCYPGCGNFADINTNNEFEDMIMKYTPCSPNECIVNIVDASTFPCSACNFASIGGARLLQGDDLQASAVTFQILSIALLNKELVHENLNSNITNANSELNGINSVFRVSGTFTEATLRPTLSPTQKPSVLSSKPHHGKSSKTDDGSKSSKSKTTKGGKNSKEGRSKQQNMKKLERKKKLEEEKGKKGFVSV